MRRLWSIACQDRFGDCMMVGESGDDGFALELAPRGLAFGACCAVVDPCFANSSHQFGPSSPSKVSLRPTPRRPSTSLLRRMLVASATGAMPRVMALAQLRARL